MIEGLLRILVVGLGLLLIWWLCGPSGERGWSARREESDARERAAHLDTRGR